MVKYVKDKTGRFDKRPHYTPEELDFECERILLPYLREKHGAVHFPIDTEDLKILIEKDVRDLDCYADLSAYGKDVEGVTEFSPGKKPIVRIAARLTESQHLENRLRTTLTHEYGHVRFHSYLFDPNIGQQTMSFQTTTQPQVLVSKRDNIFNALPSDWMEWQAGYVCGAMLMPVTHLRQLVSKFLDDSKTLGRILPSSEDAQKLIGLIASEFRVSSEASRIRLIKLGFIGNEYDQPLFR